MRKTIRIGQREFDDCWARFEQRALSDVMGLARVEGALTDVGATRYEPSASVAIEADLIGGGRTLQVVMPLCLSNVGFSCLVVPYLHCNTRIVIHLGPPGR